MDQNFGEWLKPAMTNIDEEYLKKRWAGVESLLSDLKFSEITGIIQYFTRTGSTNDELIAKIRNAFWEKDNAFSMSGNDVEIRLLCGALIIQVLRGDVFATSGLALMVATLNFHGLHPHICLQAVVEEAEKVLVKSSYSIRGAEPLPKTPQRVINAAGLFKPIKEQVDVDQWQQAILNLETVLADYAKACNRVASDNARLKAAIEIQKEETDILWWLIGAYSSDMSRPYSEINKGPASVIAGKELAALVSHRPGPASVAEIISRMLANSTGKNSNVSVSGLISKLPIKWRKQISAEADEYAFEVCPLLFAIKNSARLEDDDSWQKLFEDQFSYSLSKSLAPQVLGIQMYRESLLASEIASWE